MDYETVKYNHPDDTNVWFIDIKGNEPKWAVNIQPYYEKKENVLLTKEQYKRMLEICANPPKPTEHMLEAVKRYRERFKDDTGTSDEGC